MKNLDAKYWNNRYLNYQTGWDLGEVSPPIKNYINQLTNKDLRILIPGAGNAYEAVYLLENGFTNVTAIDFATEAIANLRNKLKDINPSNYKLVATDFFEHIGTYDLVLEQTFFCALNPSLRKDYVHKMRGLLSEEGKIAGLLFNRNFPSDGPPFGGGKQEYLSLFYEQFNLIKMEEAYNSIDARKGTELFVLLGKKN